MDATHQKMAMEFSRQLENYKGTVKSLKGILIKEKRERISTGTALKKAQKRIAELEAQNAARVDAVAKDEADRAERTQLKTLEMEVLRLGLTADRCAVLSDETQLSSLRALGRSEKTYMASAAKAKRLLHAMAKEQQTLTLRLEAVQAGAPPTPSPGIPARSPLLRLDASTRAVPGTVSAQQPETPFTFLKGHAGVTSEGALVVEKAASLMSPRGVAVEREERAARAARARRKRRDVMALSGKRRIADASARAAAAEATKAVAVMATARRLAESRYERSLASQNEARLKRLGLRRWRMWRDATELAVEAARGAVAAAERSAKKGALHARFAATKARHEQESTLRETRHAMAAVEKRKAAKLAAKRAKAAAAATRVDPVALRTWRDMRNAMRVALQASSAAAAHAVRQADAAALAARAQALRVHVAALHAERAAHGAATSADGAARRAASAEADVAAQSQKRTMAMKLRHETRRWRAETNAMWEARAVAVDACALPAAAAAERAAYKASVAAGRAKLGKWRTKDRNALASKLSTKQRSGGGGRPASAKARSRSKGKSKTVAGRPASSAKRKQKRASSAKGRTR